MKRTREFKMGLTFFEILHQLLIKRLFQKLKLRQLLVTLTHILKMIC